MMKQDAVTAIFSFGVKLRQKIINVFKISYIVLIVLFVIGGRSLILGDQYGYIFFELGKKLGEIAIIFYILTLMPGMVRRFGLKFKLVSLLMIYRRYLGLMTFFLIWDHFWFMRGIDWVFRRLLHLPLETFVVMGLLSGIILLALAITSNDWSTKKLGVWWGRIHALTYVLAWLIFLHVALQAINVWSILIGIAAFCMVISHLYALAKRR